MLLCLADRHLAHSYVDYFKCVNAKGEDFAPCKQFFRAYHSLCPSESPAVLVCGGAHADALLQTNG